MYEIIKVDRRIRGHVIPSQDEDHYLRNELTNAIMKINGQSTKVRVSQIDDGLLVSIDTGECVIIKYSDIIKSSLHMMKDAIDNNIITVKGSVLTGSGNHIKRVSDGKLANLINS